jgi:hypothetical protein
VEEGVVLILIPADNDTISLEEGVALVVGKVIFVGIVVNNRG